MSHGDLAAFNAEAEAAVALTNADLSGQLHAALAAEAPNSNLIVCPFSLLSVLAMVYAGARGNTAKQMKEALHLPARDELLHLGFERLNIALKGSPNVRAGPNTNYTLEIANRLFVTDNNELSDRFMQEMRIHYRAEPYSIDFTKNVDAAKTINEWVSEKTRGKIRNLIAMDSINALTRLVLVNGVYFKGIWAESFDRQHTSKRPFMVNPGKKVDVNMMNKANAIVKATYSKELESEIIELPFKGHRMTLIVMLPDKDDGLKNLESKLDSVNISSLVDTMTDIRMDLSLPRFKVESAIDPIQTLASMGLTDLFSERKADLSGITGSRELYVSNLRQKSLLEVNEEGAEAAGATDAIISYRSGNPQFVCDRPFAFALRDRQTGLVLFSGRVVDPTVGEAVPRSHLTGHRSVYYSTSYGAAHEVKAAAGSTLVAAVMAAAVARYL